MSRCDVTIIDKSISDVHAVIKIDKNTISLTDLRLSIRNQKIDLFSIIHVYAFEKNMYI